MPDHGEGSQKNAGKRFLGFFIGETKKFSGIRPIWEWWGFGKVSTGWRSSYGLILFSGC
jgi:hypothetical protein